MVMQTMKMEVRGTRGKGRPRMRWMDNMRHDMNKCGLEEGDAQDRRRLRSIGLYRENAIAIDSEASDSLT